MLALQVGVSVILLVGAGLLVRGIQHARTADPGFAVADTASVSIDFAGQRLPHTGYPRIFPDSLAEHAGCAGRTTLRMVQYAATGEWASVYQLPPAE